MESYKTERVSKAACMIVGFEPALKFNYAMPSFYYYWCVKNESAGLDLIAHFNAKIDSGLINLP